MPQNYVHFLTDDLSPLQNVPQAESRASEAMSTRDTIKVSGQVLSSHTVKIEVTASEYLHRLDVTCRDLKPEALLIAPNGCCKLATCKNAKLIAPTRSALP